MGKGTSRAFRYQKNQCLPSLKLTAKAPLKMDDWKINFLLGFGPIAQFQRKLVVLASVVYPPETFDIKPEIRNP